jgi:hypothetical protein
MKKLLVAAMMALGLGLGMGSAFAATTNAHSSNHPYMIHNGLDFQGQGEGGA